MEASTQVILSGLLTFGVPLILACRELLVVRRPPPGRWGGDEPPPPPPVVPPPDFMPNEMRLGRYDVNQPLPDCLVPKAPQRVRELA